MRTWLYSRIHSHTRTIRCSAQQTTIEVRAAALPYNTRTAADGGGLPEKPYVRVPVSSSGCARDKTTVNN